jgi:poly-beta-hydroxyalkanoate depolymerase
MFYHLYELGHAVISPARAAADSCKHLLRNPYNPVAHTSAGRSAAAAFEVMERVTRRYKSAFRKSGNRFSARTRGQTRIRCLTVIRAC